VIRYRRHRPRTIASRAAQTSLAENYTGLPPVLPE
jgi:hypothetical protein